MKRTQNRISDTNVWSIRKTETCENVNIKELHETETCEKFNIKSYTRQTQRHRLLADVGAPHCLRISTGMNGPS